MSYSAMRRMNSAYLLDLIRERGPVSRAELARLSGLTKPTVSSQVASLLERGVVLEDGIGEPDKRGGKPSKLLRFNPGLGSLAAAEITSREVRVCLTDLDGRALDHGSVSIYPERGADHVLGGIVEAIRDVLDRDPKRYEKLMAVAVASPGRIHPETGQVVDLENVFHWSNVSVRDPIVNAFDVPVLVENDVKLATLGEMHYGLGREVRNFVLVRLTTGIAAGLVLDGRLYQGSHWTAGEIAHMVFDRRIAAGPIDSRGYLESSIGLDRLRGRLRREYSNRNGADTSESGSLIDPVGLRDPEAAAVLADLESLLSLAIANLTAIVDPELIVLTGDLVGLVVEPIRAIVNHVIPWPTRVEVSELGHKAVLLGAVGAARQLAHELLCGNRSEFQFASRAWASRR